jgi:nucleoside-diphosphate-sugar epimerase
MFSILGVNMKILVIGGNGFVGKYLCQSLVKQGHHVRILDELSLESNQSKFEVYTGSILDNDSLKEAMRGIDYIMHLAAKHRFFGVSEQEYYLVNEQGTRNVLEAMTEMEIDKLVFFSTVAVYGDVIDFTTESTDPHPNNHYGKSKLAAEKVVAEWVKNDPSRLAIIIRPTVIFGPYNKGNVYRLIRQIYYRSYVPIGKGKNIKSVAYVENLIDATLFLMNLNLNGFEIFNYADEPHLEYGELVKLIYQNLNRKSPGFSLPPGTMLKTALIFDKLFKFLGIEFSLKTAIEKINKSTYHKADKLKRMGFVQRYSVQEGIKKMIEWYLSSKKRDSKIVRTRFV